MLNTAKDVIAVDFEFRMPHMRHPEIRCMAAVSIKTGQRWDYWADELPTSPPFSFGVDTVYLMHFGEAELACFKVLGWGFPAFIFDSYTIINQLRARPAKKQSGVKQLPAPYNHGKSLVATLKSFGIYHAMTEDKDTMRALAMSDKRSSDFTVQERADLQQYCRTDIDPYLDLLPRILEAFERVNYQWARFLNFGKFTGICAQMTHHGIPVDLPLWRNIKKRWPEVKARYIAKNDPLNLLYSSGEINRTALANYLVTNDYRWPAKPTATGELDVGQIAFKEAGRIYPELESLRQARKLYKAMEAMQRPDSGVQVASDGKARCYFSPFTTLTGRNAPTNYILGAAKALRHFIRPAKGMAIASLDYSSQEFLIAAALSGDSAMLEDYAAGDVYMAFAKRINLAPADATKESHPDARSKAKTLVLGIGYGMSAWGLRSRLGSSEDEAALMISKYWSAYPDYDLWRRDLPAKMQVDGHLELADGWRLFPVLDCNLRSVMNFPMQGTGANILRRACLDLFAVGVEMIGTNHDSIMIQASVEEIDAQVSLTKQIMIKASEVLLNGHACRVDVEQVVRYPNHWNPEAGRELYWQLIKVCE